MTVQIEAMFPDKIGISQKKQQKKTFTNKANHPVRQRGQNWHFLIKFQNKIF